ncbi:MAG: hypothetical protein L0H31_03135 [Nocardioidaceae bacterium]|nr:hypothetical protein [Nocardioidaceae bacterium]
MPQYRPQRACEALRTNPYTTCQAAEAIGIDHIHLGNNITGIVRPCPEVRERLPQLLAVPLEDLFDAELLSKPYDSSRIPREGVAP